jgi:electron transport complex protein RnfA
VSAFAVFAFSAGLSYNLVVQFGLGMGALAPPESRKIYVPFIQILSLFCSVFVLWIVFFALSSSFYLGFFEYFLYFPLSSFACFAFETAFFRVFPKTAEHGRVFNAFSAYGGIAAAALFLTRHLALSFSQALILSFHFSLGTLISILILIGIRKRACIERVPEFLRGGPVILIAMGLLSLIFTASAGIFYKIMEF